MIIKEILGVGERGEARSLMHGSTSLDQPDWFASWQCLGYDESRIANRLRRDLCAAMKRGCIRCWRLLQKDNEKKHANIVEGLSPGEVPQCS